MKLRKHLNIYALHRTIILESTATENNKQENHTIHVNKAKSG